MNDDEYRKQLVRLQNAFIEGKLDRKTYEQFKTELQDSMAVENAAGSEATDDATSTADRPDWLKDKKNQGVRKVQRVERISKGKKSKSQTSEKRGRKSDTVSLSQPHAERPEFKPIENLVDDDFEEDEQVPLTGTAAFFDLLRSRESLNVATEIAGHTGALIGLRAYIYAELSPRGSVIEGAIWGIAAGLLALLWVTTFKTLMKLIPKGSKATDFSLLKAALFLLGGMAGLFWVTIGYYYGDLVGKVVGDRFGYVNPRDGAIVGALLGGYQAWRKFLDSRPKPTKKRKRNSDDDD